MSDDVQTMLTALRSLREDTPANNFARGSILTAIVDDPELISAALAEIKSWDGS